MEHPSHEHSLILNENYIAREGDVCRACNEQIVSGKSSVYSCSRRSSITDGTREGDFYRPGRISTHEVQVIYFGLTSTIIVSCARFLLHKSCAELPAYIQNPTNPKQFLNLCFHYARGVLRELCWDRRPVYRCNSCRRQLPWDVIQFLYFWCSCNSNFDTYIYVCVKCALFQFQRSLEDRKIEHPAHSQHPLALIQRPSSFTCNACRVDDINKEDFSYICTKCQFWIHKSCAHAPTTFQFLFHHQHPLVLSFSLPRVYHKFVQHCRLCKETLNGLDWIYYCSCCRYFAHFQCARSIQLWSSGESDEDDNSDVVHLPAADESSMILLGEQFVKGMSTLYNNNNNISSSTECIKDWAHKHHLQLMTINELNFQKDNAKILVLICDGCVKPIRTDDDHQFYGCVPCKYFLHTSCAELPTIIELAGGRKLKAAKDEEKYMLFNCGGCGVPGNGIYFGKYSSYKLHIGCATLPKMMKHEAHSHKLNQVSGEVANWGLWGLRYCKACGVFGRYYHGCDQCHYYICNGCIMKLGTNNHPWDPHPLHLIYDPSMVGGDHVHDFNCEFCSEDIDTNFWFYHCTHCDLSFHLKNCFEKSRYQDYSNIKFGATDIFIGFFHPHGLTFVLNKKVRSCESCGKELLGKPVLECKAPCKAIFCTDCLRQASYRKSFASPRYKNGRSSSNLGL